MIVFLLFILGLCIGSFLNVVIDRLPGGQTLRGRSKCDHCGKTLDAKDLIPLFSYLILGGECRYCHKKISIQYPIVEFLTGVIFILVYAMFGLSLTPFGLAIFILRLILYSTLICIFVIDLKLRIIPDELIIIITVIAIIMRFIEGSLGWEAVLSGLSLFLIFLVLYILTRGRGMGMGDVKYALVMGFFLGFPKVVIGFYTAFLTGALVSIILILRGKKRFGQTIAFGPFLVFATVVADIWGNTLWVYFQRIIGI